MVLSRKGRSFSCAIRAPQICHHEPAPAGEGSALAPLGMLSPQGIHNPPHPKPGRATNMAARHAAQRSARSPYPPGRDSTYVNRCFSFRNGVSIQRYEIAAIATVNANPTKSRSA